MLLDELIRAIGQIVILTAVPLIVWFFTARKRQSFFSAVLFGLLHGATLFGALGFGLPLAVIAFTGTLGWVMGYINRKAGGSIFPSLTIHGLFNVYSCVIIMFA